MPLPPSIARLALALATSLGTIACDGGEAGGATPTATISGVVRADGGAPIASATVKVGTATTTTGADGAFELEELPVGSATLTVTAPRFDPHSASIALTSGSNDHDVTLTTQTLYTYGNAVAYLPVGVPTFKAAIVFLPGLLDPATGLPLDSRGLVRGDQVSGCSIWCTPYERTVVRSGALALAGGEVVLLGTTTLIDGTGSYGTLLDLLTQFGTLSAHPELATIPIFFIGHSMGGCTSYGFTRMNGARVAGFVTMKGACHAVPPVEAAGVPGFFLIGDLDEQYRRDNITAAFEAGRAVGAPWAVAIDPYYHNPMMDLAQMFAWADTVLTARLPTTPGGALRPMTVADGWLGDRSNGAIASYGCYSGTVAAASWLPSEATALKWQQMASGSIVTRSC